MCFSFILKGESMTVKYFISGRLPAEWEDFVPEDGYEKFPKVTISCGHKKEAIADIDEFGWVDVELMCKVLTKEIAVHVLSLICDYKDVELDERGFCQAV